MKAKIVLKIWYEGCAVDAEQMLPNDFETLDDACAYFAENQESLLNEHPVVGVEIKYV